ncbi:Lysophospholipid acyltransferase [Mucor velutinosus]|uniref:Lysophospholipid acyltransferase n=1 Tax=Mucor velutinosus TaxID=708070 RepID=A0AAN7DRE5_9FUNG|nr:Lysophospholipid acyltransferase [Mucor velutinosus]
MSSTEQHLSNIAASLKDIYTFMQKQEGINQSIEDRITSTLDRFNATDEHLRANDARLNSVEATMGRILQAIKAISPPASSTPSPLHVISKGTSAGSTSKPSAQPPQSTTSWAAIASKPPAPLSDRKRQALHRFFSPPPDDSIQNGSYTLVYLPRSRRMNRSQIRSKFRAISIDNLRILDLNFPARNTIGVLLHEAYLDEFKSKLLEIDTQPIQNFDPLDHHHVADPKYHDLSEERRLQLAHALHQDRCIRTLYFIRPHLVPGVAKYFVRQGWVPHTMATDIINQRLPRPAKRRPAPHFATAQALQASQSAAPQSSIPLPSTDSDPISLVPPAAPTLTDYFGNAVSTQEMDTTPDFASNASAEALSHTGSTSSIDTDDLSQ